MENVERKEKLQKFENLKNQKSFLDEIKNIFQFLKAYHLMKKYKFGKKQPTQALSGFFTKYFI